MVICSWPPIIKMGRIWGSKLLFKFSGKRSVMRPAGLKLKEDKDRLENKFNNSNRFSVVSLVRDL